MSLLNIENLIVGFHGNDDSDFIAADNVSFSLKKGEVLGIVGESGSGKSVTALSVLGLLPYPKAFHGKKSSIKFEGKELIGAEETSLRKIRGGDISFIFQEPMSSLNPLHTIGNQIAESIILHQNKTKKKALIEAFKLLKLTGIQNAKKRLKAYPFELSGGQRQRVMIAMAIANKPKILIADEPTTALDVTVQAQIIDLLIKLKEKIGMSIIFISHDLRLVKKIANRIIVMKDGKIVEQGNTESIFKSPQHSYTKKLINSFMSLNTNKIKSEKHTAIEAKNIKISFPIKKNLFGKVIEEIKAVDDVSVKIMQGESLGIVGESGSGKTTFGMALAKLIPAQGSIMIKAKEYSKNDKELRKTVQIVFQDPYNSLNPRLNILQIVSEGLNVHYPNLSNEEKKQRVIKILGEVGLDKYSLYKYPHEFSGGQRQRIAIARALIIEPEIVILDEPTSALDVTVQAQIIELLQQLQKKKHLTYIFISHDMKAIKAISSKIMVMKDGKIVEYGNADDLFNNPKQPYTRDLIAATN